jgi:glycine cleavage system T protein (aminomethyltransferase)
MPMSAEAPLKTSLFDWHKARGGRLVEFGGWSMPVLYTSIVEEHHAVRTRLGLFDIGHMGRLRFDGPGALDWIEGVTTNHVAKLKPGQIQYSLICLEDGGVLDDILVYRNFEADSYGVVCNASNRLRVVDHFCSHPASRPAKLIDRTLDTAMIAVQGPKALAAAQQVFEGPLGELKYYSHGEGVVLGTKASASRTGYTGEDGFELVVPADLAVQTWERLMAAGAGDGCIPCGLGARDTLRFEAAMPLYGHELDEQTNPFAVGLGMFVKLDKGAFVGREALLAKKAQPGAKRVGLGLEGKRIARQGSIVLSGGETVGIVTSGTFAPTLNRSLAMASVQPGVSQLGSKLAVDIRGNREDATVVDLPFYRRAKG